MPRCQPTAAGERTRPDHIASPAGMCTPLNRRPLLVALALLISVLYLSATAGLSMATGGIPRCGKFRSEYGPIGVYIARGNVDCRSATSRLRDFLVYGKGTDLGTGETLYQGWTCGGQMGYYFCRRPSTGRHDDIAGRGCAIQGVGCPGQIPRGSY